MSSFCSHIRRYCVSYLSLPKVATLFLWLSTISIVALAIYAKYINNTLTSSKFTLSDNQHQTQNLQNILSTTSNQLNSQLKLFGSFNQQIPLQQPNTSTTNLPLSAKLFHQELLNYFSQNTNSSRSLISIEFNQIQTKSTKNFLHNWSCSIQFCSLFNDLENFFSFLQNKNLPVIITTLSSERSPKYNLFHKIAVSINYITPTQKQGQWPLTIY